MAHTGTLNFPTLTSIITVGFATDFHKFSCSLFGNYFYDNGRLNKNDLIHFPDRSFMGRSPNYFQSTLLIFYNFSFAFVPFVAENYFWNTFKLMSPNDGIVTGL